MKKLLLILFILIAIVFSIFQFIEFTETHYISLNEVRKNIGEPMVWRSGVNFIGKNYGDYLLFLNERIPPDSTVVLPPVSMGNRFVSRWTIMKFFLQPRNVIACGSVECLEKYTDTDYYILTIEPRIFPGREISNYQDRIHYMNDKWGFVAPDNHPENYFYEIPRFENFEEAILSIITPGIWILLISSFGFVIFRLYFPSWSILSQGIVGSVFSLFSFSLVEFLFLLAGLLVSKTLIYSISGLFIFSAVMIAVRNKEAVIGSKNKAKIKWQSLIAQGLFLLIGISTILISVGKAFHASDAIGIWGSLGYGIANDGLVDGIRYWGSNPDGYPLGIPILIATLTTLFGDILPSAKIIFPIIYLGLTFTLWELFKLRAKEPWAMLFTVALISTPLISLHGIIAYANLPFAVLCVLCFTLLIHLITRHEDLKQHYFLMAMILIYAVWTRPEGMYLVFGILLILSYYLYKKNTAGWKSKSVRLLIPTISFIVFWTIASSIIYVNIKADNYLANVLTSFKAGDFHLAELWYIFHSFFEILFNPSTWGYLGIILTLSLVVLFAYKRFDPEVKLLLGSGAILIILTVGLIYLITFTDHSRCDLDCWVFTGFKRYSIPGVILVYAGAILGVLGIEPFANKYELEQG